MTRTLLHLGPGKCGSTTIGSHLRFLASGPAPHITAHQLTRQEVRGLATAAPQTLSQFERLMAAADASRPLALSHEALFKNQNALRRLVDAAQARGGAIAAVAYVRRQSDFLRSSYGQWLFRMPERIRETAGLLRGYGIDPALFEGVERHLMAVALGHVAAGRQPGGQSYFDWAESMAQVSEVLAAGGARLLVSAVPRRDAAVPLVADFMRLTGLPGPTEPSGHARSNVAFDPAVVEAVSLAAEFGYPTPLPHEGNEFLAGRSADVAGRAAAPRPFLALLSEHVDSVFASRNRRFAARFGLDPAYFEPARLRRPEDLLPAIGEEAAIRAKSAPRAADRKARAAEISRAWQTFQGAMQKPRRVGE